MRLLVPYFPGNQPFTYIGDIGKQPNQSTTNQQPINNQPIIFNDQ